MSISTPLSSFMRLTLPSTDEAFFDILDRAVTSKRIRFIMPERVVNVGRSADPSGEPEFILKVTDPDFCKRILTHGNLGLAESWMDEGWKFERGNLADFLVTLAHSDVDQKIRSDPRIVMMVASMRVQHVFTGARQNVQLHYDVGNDIYELFLDETMGYTCGYQKTPNDTLKELQENKYDRICEKLRLKEGETLLDIGCGWGGLLIHAARKYGAKTRGITLAKNQAEYAMRRVKQLGLEDRVSIDYGDFREARGVYDKVVSVGMFEHLYRHEHAVYANKVNSLLKDDGWGLVHFMSTYKAKNDPDPFTQKYIFPGSTHPPLSSAVRALEKNNLGVMDVENIGRHYLPTARYWNANWHANKHRVDATKYDARFVRMFDYLMAMYVAGCDSLVSGLVQILFTKNFRRNLPFYRV